MTTSNVHDALKQYIESNFLVELDGGKLSTSTNLFEADVIDSFGMVGLVQFLESEFGISFTNEELLSADLSSVDGMARMVEAKRTRK